MPNVTDVQWKFYVYWRGGNWDAKDWFTITSINGAPLTYAQYLAVAKTDYQISEAAFQQLMSSIRPLLSVMGQPQFGSLRVSNLMIEVYDTTDNLFFEGTV